MSDTTNPDVLTVHVQRGETGIYFVTCDQHRGLLGAGRTLAGALARVAPSLRDLLDAGPPHPDPHAFDGVDLSDVPDWHDRADPTRCHAASQRSDGECWWRHCPAKGGTCPLPQEEFNDE